MKQASNHLFFRAIRLKVYGQRFLAVNFSFRGCLDLSHFQRFLLFAESLGLIFTGDCRGIFVKYILVLRSCLRDNFLHFSARVALFNRSSLDLFMYAEQVFILKSVALRSRPLLNEVLHTYRHS